MSTLIRAPRQFRFYAVAIALAALVITLLAVAYATGPAQAKGQEPSQGQGQGPVPNSNTDGGDSDDYTNLSTYDDPQPCGPGAGTAFMKEPHEITTGHYALFDAYWRTIKEGANVQGVDVPGVGVLHTNLCPPEMVTTKTDDGFGGVTVTTTRSPRNGGMDVDESIMHVLDKHEADVVNTNAEATAGQLSLEEYPGVEVAVDAGNSVWWLRLDDPDTTGADEDETSALGIGFSTALLDKKHWLTSAEGKPMRYKFEVERHPDDPTDVPHFFAYEAPKAGNAEAKLVWDSTRADIDDDDMLMDPGEYKALQWVFTKPGTYLLWVHLQGDVRQTNPHLQDHPDYDPNWKPISGNETETSEVYRYTIQVGSELDEIEPPIFGVNLMVEENSPAGVKVGDPILVYNADAGTLYYDLTGDGHSDFELVPVVASTDPDAVQITDPHAVQIVVAEGASLDYETMPSYELNLSVTDKVDHEDNFNPYPDDVLIVKIDLKDQDPGLVLEADQAYPAVGETVNFVARYEPTPERDGREPGYTWAERVYVNDSIRWHAVSPPNNAPTWSVSQSSVVTKVYQVVVTLDAVAGETQDVRVTSNEAGITWGGP